MMPSRQRRLFAVICCSSLLAACSSTPIPANSTGVGGTVVNTVATTATSIVGGPIIPNTSIQLGPSVSYPLEKLVYWGAYIGAAYLILDPFSPNWEIQEARFPGNHVHLSLTMKRYYAGGAGEARVVFNRRAKELMRAGGYGSYEIVEYSEGMESSLIGSQRTAEGVVHFVKKPG
jgi:hypothetical protein